MSSSAEKHLADTSTPIGVTMTFSSQLKIGEHSRGRAIHLFAAYVATHPQNNLQRHDGPRVRGNQIVRLLLGEAKKPFDCFRRLAEQARKLSRLASIIRRQIGIAEHQLLSGLTSHQLGTRIECQLEDVGLGAAIFPDLRQARLKHLAKIGRVEVFFPERLGMSFASANPIVSVAGCN